MRYVQFYASREDTEDPDDILHDLIVRAKRAVWHGTEEQARNALEELDGFLDSDPAVTEIDGALIILEDLWDVFHGFAPRPR